MNIPANIATLLLALCPAMALTLQAGEKAPGQDLKDFPESVQKTMSESAGKGTVAKVEKETGKDGAVVYEAEIKMEDGKSKDILVDSQGKLISTETPSTLADAPEAVRKSLETLAKGGKVAEIELVTLADGTLQYEAEIAGKDGKETEVLVSADGKVISQEEDKDDGDDDEDADDGDRKSAAGDKK